MAHWAKFPSILADLERFFSISSNSFVLVSENDFFKNYFWPIGGAKWNSGGLLFLVRSSLVRNTMFRLAE